jgi:hypothetical protein
MFNESNRRGEFSDIGADPHVAPWPKGLFQFTPRTAARYGLMGPGFDYRLDPQKEAEAAARYAHDILARGGPGDVATKIAAHYYGGSGQDVYAAKLRTQMAKYAGGAGEFAAGMGGVAAPEVDVPGSLAGAAVGQALGTVEVYIHMDPGFPGKVTATGSPNVVVRRAS